MSHSFSGLYFSAKIYILLYYPHIFCTTGHPDNTEKYAEKDCPVMCPNIVKTGVAWRNYIHETLRNIITRTLRATSILMM